jgi:hypothetical protein
LQVTFGFAYESTTDLEGLVDLGQVAALAEQLAPVKKTHSWPATMRCSRSLSMVGGGGAGET